MMFNFGSRGVQLSFVSALSVLQFLPLSGFAQPAVDTERSPDFFTGRVSATHNGISLVPAFSLGKPALLFDLKLGRGRWSFEPDLRFALEGKPWTFLFWWRYKAVSHKRFNLRLGAHPAINFRTIEVADGDGSRSLLEARRYLAAEVAPSLRVSERLTLGAYYLPAYGFDAGARRTHFANVNAFVGALPLGERLELTLIPSVYYLRIDALDGVYAAGTVRLAAKRFPLYLESLFSKEIRTQIATDGKPVWNVSLVYGFKSEFRRVVVGI